MAFRKPTRSDYMAGGYGDRAFEFYKDADGCDDPLIGAQKGDDEGWTNCRDAGTAPTRRIFGCNGYGTARCSHGQGTKKEGK